MRDFSDRTKLVPNRWGLTHDLEIIQGAVVYRAQAPRSEVKETTVHCVVPRHLFSFRWTQQRGGGGGAYWLLPETETSVRP